MKNRSLNKIIHAEMPNKASTVNKISNCFAGNKISDKISKITKIICYVRVTYIGIETFFISTKNPCYPNSLEHLAIFAIYILHLDYLLHKRNRPKTRRNGED